MLQVSAVIAFADGDDWRGDFFSHSFSFLQSQSFCLDAWEWKLDKDFAISTAHIFPMTWFSLKAETVLSYATEELEE